MKRISRISIRVNVLELDKTRFVNSTYNDKDGNKVTKKEVLLDVVVMDKDKHKVVASGDSWNLINVGFVTEQANKEERNAKQNRPIIGNATMFEDKTPQPNFDNDSQGNKLGNTEEDTIDPSDIPF